MTAPTMENVKPVIITIVSASVLMGLLLWFQSKNPREE